MAETAGMCTIGGTEYTYIPGSLRVVPDNDMNRGGGDSVPNCVKGEGLTGQVDILITDSVTLASILAKRSGVGVGSVEVSYTPLIGSQGHAYNCLIEVDVNGDGVQTATVKWKGTKN